MMTQNRLVLVAALAGLIVLSAGCIGLFGSGETSVDTPTPVEDDSSTDGTTTPSDDGPENSGEDDGDDTTTPDASEVVDGDVLFDENSAAIRDAGVFSAEQRIDLTRDGEYIGAEELSITYNLDDEQGVETAAYYNDTSRFAFIERYTGPETTWWNEPDEDPRMYSERPIEVERYVAPFFMVEWEEFHPSGAGIEFERVGETTHNGEDVMQYEATGEADDVDEIEATLYVNEGGAIVYIDLEVTDDGVTIEAVMEITALGDGTVEPPEWVPDGD